MLGICRVCKKNKATEWHHLFSQTKANKKLYGKLIHNKANLLPICEECHKSKGVPKLTEYEFCDKLGIAPRSKTAELRKLREG